MSGFRYEENLLAVFPSIRGGVIHAVGLDNAGTSPTLTDRFRVEQAKVKDDLGDTPLSEFPSISAWRSAFSRFGVKPTQYRSAAEALLRRLTKQGDIPSINRMVDMANLVSIRHRLPVAVFDQAAVTGVTTVRFADGTERFTDLGSDVVSNPESGEVIFVDGRPGQCPSLVLATKRSVRGGAGHGRGLDHCRGASRGRRRRRRRGARGLARSDRRISAGI
jgi:DNA/RNA-binding domain of Phe-tRNA-synthetase-like protein